MISLLVSLFVQKIGNSTVLADVSIIQMLHWYVNILRSVEVLRLEKFSLFYSFLDAFFNFILKLIVSVYSLLNVLCVCVCECECMFSIRHHHHQPHHRRRTTFDHQFDFNSLEYYALLHCYIAVLFPYNKNVYCCQLSLDSVCMI